MSNNQIDEFEPFGDMLDRMNAERMANRSGPMQTRGAAQKPDHATQLLADMDADRDRQIAQLSQTEHGRKVLAGHGIISTAPKPPVPHPNPNRGMDDGAPDSQDVEGWLADEGNLDADFTPGGKHGLREVQDGAGAPAPSGEAQGNDGAEMGEGDHEPELHDNEFPIVQRGTQRDHVNGEAMAAKVQQTYSQLLAEGKISKVGPDGVAVKSVTYHNYNIKTPGSHNSTIHGLSQEVGEYGPEMKIDLFLDGTTSFREALHTYAHEVCHGDPALSDRASGADAHSDPAIEAVCNVYANKVVKAYFGE